MNRIGRIERIAGYHGGDVRTNPEGDAGKPLFEPFGRAERTIDAARNVSGEHAVSIAVDVGLKPVPVGLLRELHGDECRSFHRLESGLHQPRGDIRGRGGGARSVEAFQDERNRDRGKNHNERQREQQFEKRVSARHVMTVSVERRGDAETAEPIAANLCVRGRRSAEPLLVFRL